MHYRVFAQRVQNTISTGHMHPYVYGSIIYNSQIMEAAQVSIDRWMDKEDMIYILWYIYYSAIKKDEILPFATIWIELESIMLSEISQSKKDRYHMISLIYGI